MEILKKNENYCSSEVVEKAEALLNKYASQPALLEILAAELEYLAERKCSVSDFSDLIDVYSKHYAFFRNINTPLSKIMVQEIGKCVVGFSSLGSPLGAIPSEMLAYVYSEFYDQFLKTLDPELTVLFAKSVGFMSQYMPIKVLHPDVVKNLMQFYQDNCDFFKKADVKYWVLLINLSGNIISFTGETKNVETFFNFYKKNRNSFGKLDSSIGKEIIMAVGGVLSSESDPTATRKVAIRLGKMLLSNALTLQNIDKGVAKALIRQTSPDEEETFREDLTKILLTLCCEASSSLAQLKGDVLSATISEIKQTICRTGTEEAASALLKIYVATAGFLASLEPEIAEELVRLAEYLFRDTANQPGIIKHMEILAEYAWLYSDLGIHISKNILEFTSIEFTVDGNEKHTRRLMEFYSRHGKHFKDVNADIVEDLVEHCNSFLIDEDNQELAEFILKLCAGEYEDGQKFNRSLAKEIEARVEEAAKQGLPETALEKTLIARLKQLPKKWEPKIPPKGLTVAAYVASKKDVGGQDVQPGDAFMSASTLALANQCLFSGLKQNAPWTCAYSIVCLSSLVEALVSQNRIIYIYDEPLFSERLPMKRWVWGLPDKERRLLARIESLLKTPALRRRGEFLNFLKGYGLFRKLAEEAATYLKLSSVPFDKKWTEDYLEKLALHTADTLEFCRFKNFLYLPNPVESTFSTYHLVNENLRGASAARIAIMLIESARERQAVKANQRKQAKVFDTRLPMIFAAVLKEADKPEDIIPIALQMRATKEAKVFREWVVSVDNDRSLGNFNKELDEVQNLADSLASRVKERPRRISLQFGISVIPPAPSIGVSVDGPELRGALLTKRKKHLTFLHSIFDVSMSIANLSREINRVFKIRTDTMKEVIEHMW